MKNILASVWPVLAVDAVIYILQELLYGSAADGAKGVPGTISEILGFGLVAVAAFMAARKTGRIKTAMIVTVLFWFVWRPLLFVVALPIAILFHSLNADQVMQATLGLMFALLLFSPVALGLGWLGGIVGRRAQQK